MNLSLSTPLLKHWSRIRVKDKGMDIAHFNGKVMIRVLGNLTVRVMVRI